MRHLICFLLFSTSLMAQNYHYALDDGKDNDQDTNITTYTLKEAATTSAGVYKGETLLRTLWSNERKEKGTYDIDWDGLDDEGQRVATGSYEFKLLSNNVDYKWEGAKIGNTSKNLTGKNRYHGLTGFFKFIVVDDAIYWSNGYNEQRTAANTSSIDNPQVTVPILDKGAIVKYICADDNYIYWSGHDVHADTSFVFVTRRSDNAEHKYSKARSLEVTYSRTYISALNILQGKNSYITGLARSGNYLFVARQLQNTVHVLDLSAGGVLAHTIRNITAPRELKTDGKGNLWIISDQGKVSKHRIDPNGNIGEEMLALSGLEQPLTLGVTPNGNEIAICDGGNRQQVRFFDSTNGTEGAAFGQSGGYINSPEVSNDKFYFIDTKSRKFNGDIHAPQKNHAAISFQKDGSFWVLDTGNNRMMHYDRNRRFVDKIQYIPDWLMMSVDKNDSSRLFIDFLEFEIDYNKEDVAKSWRLKNNWGYNISDRYNNAYGKIREPVTLSNGKTYFLLTDGQSFTLAELSANGVRPTGQVLDGFDWVWLGDGSLVHVDQAQLGKDVTWHQYQLTGFDNGANPEFSSRQILAQRKNVQGDEPLYRVGAWLSVTFLEDNQLVTFDGRPEENGMGYGYHLGLLDTDTNEWLFKTSKATGSSYDGEYPLDGRFDTDHRVSYAGSKAMTFGENIVWGYYGEFWRGGFQVNQYAHYFKNGLLLNVFGTNALENPNGTQNPGMQIPFEGIAGNSLTPHTVFHPSDSDIAYLYHPDESWHGGVHRWKISNLNSVREQIIPLVVE